MKLDSFPVGFLMGLALALLVGNIAWSCPVWPCPTATPAPCPAPSNPPACPVCPSCPSCPPPPAQGGDVCTFRRRLKAFYQRYAPSKATDQALSATMSKLPAGQEDRFMRMLEAKYGPEDGSPAAPYCAAPTVTGCPTPTDDPARESALRVLGGLPLNFTIGGGPQQAVAADGKTRLFALNNDKITFEKYQVAPPPYCHKGDDWRNRPNPDVSLLDPPRSSVNLYPFTDAERFFNPHLGPLPPDPPAPVPDIDKRGTAVGLAAYGTLPEDRTLRAAFAAWDAAPNNNESIPVYAFACVASADCYASWHHFEEIDTAVGHIIVVVGRDTTSKYAAYFERFVHLFPGRFTFVNIRRPQGVSASEAWNTILKLGFSIVPTPAFVMINGADLWWHKGNLRKIGELTRSNASGKVAGLTPPAPWGSFAMPLSVWQTVGPFDESIWPAYGEDNEYESRMQGLGQHEWRWAEQIRNPTYTHLGSLSRNDPLFKQWNARYDKLDYLTRKWGSLNRYEAWKHPFNDSRIPSNFWIVDPVHRRCIVCNDGTQHLAVAAHAQEPCQGQSMCAGSCWYNTSLAVALGARPTPDESPADRANRQRHGLAVPSVHGPAHMTSRERIAGYFPDAAAKAWEAAGNR